jgi:hypothetical protein
MDVVALTQWLGSHKIWVGWPFKTTQLLDVLSLMLQEGRGTLLLTTISCNVIMLATWSHGLPNALHILQKERVYI